MNDQSASVIRCRSGRSAAILVSALAVAGGLVGVAAGPAGAKSKPTTVIATETDFHIKLSKNSFSPGKYTFVAVNSGQVTHALEITGPGLSAPHTKNFQPGQKASLSVTLKKGAYDIFCPVPGHKALGMNVNIKVGSQVSTASKSSGSGSGGASGG